MAQPLKVTCPSCSSKFHIPLHLVRGKIVSFRCKNCRGTIPVDGRAISSATPQPMQAPTVLPPDAADPNSSFYGDSSGDSSMRLSLSDGIVVHEGSPSVSGLQVDTPAAFAHSNPQPPSRPRAAFGASRTPPVGFVPSATGSVPPTAISRSHAPDAARLSEPPPSVRRPAGGKKIVAAVALLGAAGLTLWSTSLRRSPRPLATATPTTAVEHGPIPPRQPTDEHRAAEP